MSSREKNLVIARSVLDQGLTATQAAARYGVGRAHAANPILMLIHYAHVLTSHAETGEVLAEHHIGPNRDYQPPTPTTLMIVDTMSRDIDDQASEPAKKS